MSALETGQEFASLGMHETAEGCFSKAMLYIPLLLSILNTSEGLENTLRNEISLLIFEIYTYRAANASSMKQQALAVQLYSKASDLVSSQMSSDLHFAKGLRVKLIETLIVEAHPLIISRDPLSLSYLRRALDSISTPMCACNQCCQFQVELAGLEAKVLRMLAWAYSTIENDGTAALNCVNKLKELPTMLSQNFTSFLAVKCYCQLNRPDEAETEFLNLCTTDGVAKELYMEAISAVVQLPNGTAILQEAADALLEHFPSDPSLLLHVIHCLLDHSPAKDVNSRYVSADAVVLRVLANDAIMCTKLLLKSDDLNVKKLRDTVYRLLWNRATFHFQAQNYKSSSSFFAAAYQFASPELEQSKVARFCALSHVGLREWERAHEYLDVAEKLKPKCIYSHFIRLKIFLEQNAPNDALKLLQQMILLPDFDIHLLRVTCQEALSCDMLLVAKEALQLLHKEVVRENANKPCDLQESIIMRCLIHVTEKMVISSTPFDGTQQDVISLSSDFTELAKLYTVALGRFRGCSGTEILEKSLIEDKMPLEIDYFAAAAWNLAKKASEKHDYQSCTELFRVSAGFYSLHPRNGVSELKSQKIAFLMAAASAIESWKRNESSSRESDLQVARECLLDCRRVSKALTARLEPQLTMDKSDIFLIMKEVELALISKNSQETLQLLEEASNLPQVSSKNLLSIARLCFEPAVTDTCAGKRALQMALSKATDSDPLSPDAVSWALVVLVQNSLNDEEKLCSYSTALKFISSLRYKDLPEMELLYLATTAWNKGVNHAKLDHINLAKSYMSTALSLAASCKSLQDKIEELKKQYSQLVQRRAVEDLAVEGAASIL
eukprot:jgi/Botrbrau1/7154/Bobra.0143s0026.2